MFLYIFVLVNKVTMYQTLLLLHSYTRWLVLGSLLYAIYRAWIGSSSGRVYSGKDNSVRHWTATICHLQLMIGMVLYFQSPVVRLFWSQANKSFHHFEAAFYSILHMMMMLTAILIVTIGSALTKRRKSDREKFRTMLTWFGFALFLILIAIPWPFSPIANRPYFR